MVQFFTIGHSTHSGAEFLAILQAVRIEAVADVRAIPRSRTNPQFNSDTLSAALSQHGIEYVHLPELGGRRGRQQSASPNMFWQNQSFRNFADYAMSGAFRAGLLRLLDLGH